jgi:hypothetical protein
MNSGYAAPLHIWAERRAPAEQRAAIALVITSPTLSLRRG